VTRPEGWAAMCDAERGRRERVAELQADNARESAVLATARELVSFAEALNAQAHSPRLDEYLGVRVASAINRYGACEFGAAWDRLTGVHLEVD
jgi:hypothetical protein